MADCKVDGCDRTSVAHRMCRPHYGRYWRTGNVRADAPIGSNQPAIRVPGRISVHEAAVILGVSDTTVRRYGDEGHLTVHLDVRGWRWFDPAEVRGFHRVDEATVRPVPAAQVVERVPRRPVRRFDLVDDDEL